jgi:hypothetical protein
MGPDARNAERRVQEVRRETIFNSVDYCERLVTICKFEERHIFAAQT